MYNSLVSAMRTFFGSVIQCLWGKYTGIFLHFLALLLTLVGAILYDTTLNFFFLAIWLAALSAKYFAVYYVLSSSEVIETNIKPTTAGIITNCVIFGSSLIFLFLGGFFIDAHPVFRLNSLSISVLILNGVTVYPYPRVLKRPEDD